MERKLNTFYLNKLLEKRKLIIYGIEAHIGVAGTTDDRYDLGQLNLSTVDGQVVVSDQEGLRWA